MLLQSGQSAKRALPTAGVGQYDVLPGNSRHCGNVFYRGLLAKNYPRYSDAKDDSEKDEIVNHILDTILGMGGRFLTFDTTNNELRELSRDAAYKKVRHDKNYRKTRAARKSTLTQVVTPNILNATRRTTARSKILMSSSASDNSLQYAGDKNTAQEQSQHLPTDSAIDPTMKLRNASPRLPVDMTSQERTPSSSLEHEQVAPSWLIQLGLDIAEADGYVRTVFVSR